MHSEQAASLLPLEILSRTFNFANDDEAKWWHTTAPLFAKMLINANYDVHAQYRFLCLHREFVVPNLGAYPTAGAQVSWKSMLTRYGLPFELSYNVSQSLVRFAFEPIGSFAGTEQDLFNTKAITETLHRFGKIVPGLHLEWYNSFRSDLIVSDEEAKMARNTTIPFRTQSVIAADMEPNGDMLLKAYFCPRIKSVVTDKSKERLMFDAIRKVDHDGQLKIPLSTLTEFLASRASEAGAQGSALIAHFFSCDLVQPSESRIKMYCYETKRDFDALTSDWTLGGRRNDPQTLAGLELLKELWDLLPITEGRSEGPPGFHELGTSPAERLPFIINFSLCPGNPIPEPQIYFPVFGYNDTVVANALKAFFRRMGWIGLADSYMANLCEYYPDEDLANTNHALAWISYSFKKGKPYMTVYHYSYGTFESFLKN